MQFSEELNDKLKQHFLKRSGIELSDDKANLYLERLAAFGMEVTLALQRENTGETRVTDEAS